MLLLSLFDVSHLFVAEASPVCRFIVDFWLSELLPIVMGIVLRVKMFDFSERCRKENKIKD